jgi:hypothetical protein
MVDNLTTKVLRAKVFGVQEIAGFIIDKASRI